VFLRHHRAAFSKFPSFSRDVDKDQGRTSTLYPPSSLLLDGVSSDRSLNTPEDNVGKLCERAQVRLLPNFPPPHANRGFLVVRTNHSSDARDVAANSALTKRVVSRTQTIHWPVSKHRPERMVTTGERPRTLDLPLNIFYSSYIIFLLLF
jgi:hypothetical protein